MLNFLFEGAIGELLAPVSSPYHQLQLAIQRQEHDKVYEMLTSGGLDPGGLGEKTGLAPIHYAAKYNNRNALELILSRGVSVNQADRSGNTALHYAAAGGYFDLVQFLTSQGAAPAARNAAMKTPYDMSSNVLVSQFLMPLQLAAEQDDGGAYAPPPLGMTQSITGGYAGGYVGYSGYSQPTQPPHDPLDISDPVHFPPPTHAAPAPIAMPPIPGPVPPTTAADVGYVGGYTPWSSTAAPATTTTTSPTATSAMTAPEPAASRAPSMPVSGGSRAIRPDGFHSSATDPALQEKYGHTRHVKVTAPPPTGGAGAPSSYHMFTPQAPQPSLYVPYDFQTRSAPGVPQYATTSPPALPPGGFAPPPQAHTPPPATHSPTATGISTTPTHRTSSTGQSSTPLVHLNVFNPAADNVVSASSSSSSVL